MRVGAQSGELTHGSVPTTVAVVQCCGDDVVDNRIEQRIQEPAGKQGPPQYYMQILVPLGCTGMQFL